MTTRPAKPAKMSWVVPYITVADSGATAKFYQEHFGFELLSSAQNDEGQVFHAEFRYKDIVIMCGNAGFYGEATKTPAQGGFFPSLTLYLYHDDVDALYESLKKKGIPVDAAPEDQFWGDRMLRLTDIDGHQWSFATHVADHA